MLLGTAAPYPNSNSVGCLKSIYRYRSVGTSAGRIGGLPTDFGSLRGGGKAFPVAEYISHCKNRLASQPIFELCGEVNGLTALPTGAIGGITLKSSG